MTHSSTITRLRSNYLTFSLLLLFGITTHAQTLVAPTAGIPDIVLGSTSMNEGINCDMLTTPSGHIMAFAYNTSTGIDIEIRDDAGGMASMSIPGGQWGDVVLGDSLNAVTPGTEYILGIVYVSGTDIYFRTYTLSGVGSGTITQALATNTLVPSSNSGDIAPHIDMFPDLNNTVGGYPSMHEFILTSSNFSGTSTNVDAFYGEIADPVGTTNSTTIVTAGTGSVVADVSASYNLNTGDKIAYFAVAASGIAGLDVIELNISAPTPTPTTVFVSSGSLAVYPRIESMGLFDNNVSSTPWTVASPVFNSGTSSFDAWEFTAAGGFNCSSSGFSGMMNFASAVAAGIGSFSSTYCNDNYTIGWCVEQNTYCVTQAVDYFTGAISTGIPNYYQVSNTVNGIPVGKVCFALSSCSNSGKELLTAWNDLNGSIRYKVTPDVLSYKPGATGIENTALFNEVSIFPVPATDLLTIGHPNTLAVIKIEIFNMLGQVVYQGNAEKTGQTVISVAGYASGLYMVRIHTDKGTIDRKVEIIK